MTWVAASILLFGGLVALMCLGLPVAIAFLAINIVGALCFSAASRGCRSSRATRLLR